MTEEAANPRYVQYARLYGKSAEEMLVIDADVFPGGKMAGFMIFISEMTRKFGFRFGHDSHLFHPEMFTKFIEAEVSERLASKCIE